MKSPQARASAGIDNRLMKIDVEIEYDVRIPPRRRCQLSELCVQIPKTGHERLACLPLELRGGSGSKSLDVTHNIVKFLCVFLCQWGNGEFRLATSLNTPSDVAFLPQAMKGSAHRRAAHFKTLGELRFQHSASWCQFPVNDQL